jgi:hypothetical protein
MNIENLKIAKGVAPEVGIVETMDYVASAAISMIVM